MVLCMRTQASRELSYHQEGKVLLSTRMLSLSKISMLSQASFNFYLHLEEILATFINGYYIHNFIVCL